MAPETLDRCAHNGGTGVGAGHECRCVRPAGHALDSDRPHGCTCGALWADSAIYPPLTAAEFEAGCGFTYRGIPLCEDEYGDYVYAYGHIDKADFAAAVNDHDSEMGASAEGCTAHDVEHRWAVTVHPPDSPDGWFIRWAGGDDPVTMANPQAFPISLVSR